MDPLRDVSIALPCNQCGQRYEVALGQILLSHDARQHDCVARGDVECEPLFDAALLDRDLIEEFAAVWTRLASAAQDSGGELRISSSESRK